MNADKILTGLNPKQKEAAMRTEGPLLVIAGAGSGKTLTLTRRVAYMMANGVSPYSILAVTFTNKAAREMKNRISGLLADLQPNTKPDEVAMPLVGTFHSVCLRFLRKEASLLGLDPGLVVYDTQDSQALLKHILKEKHIDTDETKPQSVQYIISDAKNNLVDEKDFINYTPTSYLEEVVQEVYPIYQKRLRENNALDFDDIIMLTVKMFEGRQDILERYQEKYKYLMIDEYQDTNEAQYRLIKRLADKYKNLCVVGDDYQAIYSWRGANFKNILNFEKDYQNAKVVMLEQNYRSTQVILDAANKVIEKNIERTSKNLWTDKKEGELIQLVEAENEYQESQFVAKKIRELVARGEVKLKEVACLYRTNAQSRALEEAFLATAIKYQVVGGTKFYDRAEIKDVLGYLRFIYNPKDEAAFRRIINNPKRSIGAVTINKITAIYQDVRDKGENISIYDVLMDASRYQIKLSGKALKGVESFVKVITELRANLAKLDMTLSRILVDLLKKTEYLAQFEKKEADEGRIENIEELFSVTQKFDEMQAMEGLNGFLEETSLLSDADTMEEENSVTLMTLHAAKGLEFKVVFLVGLEEGLLPHSRSLISQSDLEEERRLCYVGITRAKDRLFLTYTQIRRIFGKMQSNPSSRFINEIPEHLLEDISLLYTDFSADSDFDETWDYD
jgi:DNA helicase-2/ATP-dependent DNA helicase PcrA